MPPLVKRKDKLLVPNFFESMRKWLSFSGRSKVLTTQLKVVASQSVQKTVAVELRYSSCHLLALFEY